MSVRHAYPSRLRARRTTAAVAGVVALSTAIASCTTSAGSPALDEISSPPTSSAAPVSQATVTSNISNRDMFVPVDEVVELVAQNGTFDEVGVAIAKGRQQLEGKFSDDKTTWTSTERLEPGLRYKATSVATDVAGLPADSTITFRTDDLTLDEQTFPSIAPLQGETVGVGMPAIVQFDVPVTDRAAIEKHLSVRTSPKQIGAWHWISDSEIRWRPKTYWKPGTEVTVDADINSVDAGNGIFGQISRSTTFFIGDSVVSKVDVANYQMKVFINGELARTVPVSAGKPGFITRSGTKVIIEKVRNKTMDAATIGIPKSSPDYYKLDVEYAMRVTYSGEFLHAAPWSTGSQGFENVSHGCVGMGETDAAWLFNITKRGDVVQVTGSKRQMTLENGYGDWNFSFSDYKAGSALS